MSDQHTDPTEPRDDAATDLPDDVVGEDEATVPGFRRGPRELTADELRGTSRRAVLTGGLATVAGVVGFRALQNQERRGRTPELLRSSYEFNESLWRRLTSDDNLAPEFDFARSGMPIVNGRRGIEDDVDVAAWRLSVEGPDGEQLDELDIDDVRALPFTESIFEFKCIEGWSQITAFGGTRFSDLVARYPGMEQLPWVAMNVPGGGYPVSMDMQALLHPQTLLAWEMQREPLTQGHGAPLRLATPLKYGIKNIRRVATIRFTTEQPEDFWGSRGYSEWVGL